MAFTSSISRVARRTLIGACTAALLCGTATIANAQQAWPARPVRIIVPATPGGSSDPLARIFAEELSRALNGSFVVENRAGANGNVGAALVAKAEPDGYTILMSWTGTLVSAVTLYTPSLSTRSATSSPSCCSAASPT